MTDRELLDEAVQLLRDWQKWYRARPQDGGAHQRVGISSESTALLAAYDARQAAWSEPYQAADDTCGCGHPRKQHADPGAAGGPTCLCVVCTCSGFRSPCPTCGGKLRVPYYDGTGELDASRPCPDCSPCKASGAAVSSYLAHRPGLCVDCSGVKP